jgi:hypothetical protein
MKSRSWNNVLYCCPLIILVFLVLSKASSLLTTTTIYSANGEIIIEYTLKYYDIEGSATGSTVSKKQYFFS